MRKIKNVDNEIPQMELLTPLTGGFYSDEPHYDYGEEVEAEGGKLLDGAGLARYEQPIIEMIKKKNEMDTGGKLCNLMDYFDGSEEIKKKVERAVVSVKNVDGILYGCTTLTLNEFLESTELTELCEYITGQYSDGWGEGFEQREINVDGGSLYVHFWQMQDFTVQEKAAEQKLTEPEGGGARPKLKLIGHDGNIFSIMADAKQLLIKNGQSKEADEMIGRVKDSGNYYKALNIISEYVKTELSDSKEGKISKGKQEKEGECR